MAALPFSNLVNLLYLLALSAVSPDIKIELSGNIFFQEQYLLQKKLAIRNKQDVEDAINGILDLYNNAGFAFCTVKPQFIYDDSTVTKIRLMITEGDRIIITDYVFKTTGHTSAAALKKISRLRNNSYFSLKDITDAKNILTRTGVVSMIKDNIIFLQDKFFLVFDIEEDKTDYLNGFGALAQDNFYFGIGYQTLNLLGTLRRCKFDYKSGLPSNEEIGFNNSFLLEFVDPVLISPVTLDINFLMATYDTARLSQLTGKVTAPVNDHLRTSVLSGLEMVNYLADTIRSSYRTSLLGAGIELQYEMKNSHLLQTAEIDYLFRDNDRLRIRYDGQISMWSLFILPHYRWSKTAGYDYFDYYHLGGSTDIRGYLEEEFTAREALWFNVEHRKTFVFPLFDFGWLDNRIVYSYGIGFSATSSFAKSLVIFAWPRQGRWQDGKVHFTIKKGL